MPPFDDLIQRHFANLRHLRDTFAIDPRAQRGAGQIAPWISGVVQIVHPAFPGAFQFSDPVTRIAGAPAAGNEHTIVVPPNEAWRIRALKVDFTTDANVADRTPILLIRSPGPTTVFQVTPTSVQAASLVRGYHYGMSFGYEAELGSDKVHGLPDVVLDEGSQLQTSTVNLQVGDQYSAMNLLVDIFPR